MRPWPYSRCKGSGHEAPSSYTTVSDRETTPRPGLQQNLRMERKTLTPGKLYALLSAEFHRVRPEECRACRMPMVQLIAPRDFDSPNWKLEAFQCTERCTEVVKSIAKMFGERYELFDPVSVHYRPKPVFTGRGAFH